MTRAGVTRMIIVFRHTQWLPLAVRPLHWQLPVSGPFGHVRTINSPKLQSTARSPAGSRNHDAPRPNLNFNLPVTPPAALARPSHCQ